MTVLVGHATAEEKMSNGDKVLRGKILSSVAMKKTRVNPPAPAVQEASPPAEKTYGSDFANRPRFTDSRPQQRVKPNGYTTLTSHSNHSK
jgi:hypothetical protein